MAYNMKDVFYLDTSILTTTGAGDGLATLDLSSFVDPISRGRNKGTGLAIYKVHFNFCTQSGNGPIAAATTGQMRAALLSFSGLPATAVGSTITFADGQLAASNDLLIAGADFAAGGTAAGDPAPHVFCEPSEDVPYVVVRDQVALCLNVTTAMSVASSVHVRMECAQVTLDQSTLNQLLRTQTV